jgi:hypothetical protein
VQQRGVCHTAAIVFHYYASARKSSNRDGLLHIDVRLSQSLSVSLDEDRHAIPAFGVELAEPLP